MTTRLAQTRWQSLHTLFGHGALRALPDPDLLECYRRDPGAGGQEAFRILVERHGPMILGLCRSLVSDPHDAEDAFQATFLVLVRRRRAIWVRDSIGPWLHGVASRVAQRARQRKSQRRRVEGARLDDIADARTSSPSVLTDEFDSDRAIHEEITRLPASLRESIVLCGLQGLTYGAAARQLNVPEPTIRGRIRRARRRLANKLRERGITLSVPVAAAPAATESLPLSLPTLPPELVAETLRHAFWWSSMSTLVGGSPTIPASIGILARGVIRSMLLSACRVAGSIAILISVVLGTAIWTRPGEPRALARKHGFSPTKPLNPSP